MAVLKKLSFALLADLAFASAVRRPMTGRYRNNRKRDNGDCADGGPWVDTVFVGGYASGTDTDWCETLYPTYAYPINGITIFATGEAVRGLQFAYASPSGLLSQIYGATSGSGITEETITIDYAGGETITSAVLFGPVSGSSTEYVHGMIIETSAGQVVQGGVSTSGDDSPANVQDVGVGILVGADGAYQSGVTINDLGLLFLNSPIANVEISNLNFQNGPAGAAGITPTTLAAQHFYNGASTGSDSWSFSGSKAITSTSTYTQMTTNTFGSTYMTKFGGSLSLFGKAFSITASGTNSYTWSSAAATTTTTTSTTVETLSWKQGGSLDPSQGITCDSVAGEGQGTFPYTSTVTITLQNGETWSTYGEYGSLALNEVSANSVSCVQDNNPSQ